MLILVAAALAAEPAPMVGVGLDVVAWHTSARHDLHPALTAFAHLGPSTAPWSVALEATTARRIDGDAFVRYRTVHLRADALAGVALGTHATRFHASLGPALTVRAVAVASDAASTAATRLEPGVRGRVALDGPLVGRLGWAWHVGATTRGPGLDWDAGLGFGVRL